MPQWRKLHVKTIESLDINDMPDDFTRLMWVLLPLKLDKEGRGLDNPAWVKSNLFPLRMDVTLEMVSEAMDWFTGKGMIERYEVDGRHYFYIPTFHKYQDTRREAESNYPPPPDSESTQDQVEGDDCEGNEQGQTSSRVSPELVQSKSSLDVEENRISIEAEKPANPHKKHSKLPANQAMFGKLAEICKIDWRICTDGQRGELNQSEKILRVQAKATPEDLERFEKWWYQHDWRGKKGEPPKPAQVREVWGKFINPSTNGRDSPGQAVTRTVQAEDGGFNI